MNRILVWTAGSLAAVLAAAQAAAAYPFAAPDVAAHAPGAAATGLGQVTLALGAVLIAIFALAWLARQLRGFSRKTDSVIRVIAELAVGPKERAVLLQIGTARLLIGVAPGRVSALHVLTGDASESLSQASATAQADSDIAQLKDAPPRPPTFRDLLRRSLGR